MNNHSKNIFFCGYPMSAKKKKPEPDDKKQYARFLEAAKKIEEPLPKKAFEEAFDKIVKKKRVTKS